MSEYFFIKWEQILYNAEKNLVELFLYESSKVRDRKLHPDDYKMKHIALTNNNKFYKKQLEKRSS